MRRHPFLCRADLADVLGGIRVQTVTKSVALPTARRPFIVTDGIIFRV